MPNCQLTIGKEIPAPNVVEELVAKLFGVEWISKCGAAEVARSPSAPFQSPETSPKVEATLPAGQMSNRETKAEIEALPNREVRSIEPDFREALSCLRKKWPP